MDPVELAIRTQYPQMAWALAHPELGPLLRQAVAEGWDAPRLQGALLNTNWYKSTADSEREWDRLWQEDPAEGQKRFAISMERVTSAAARLGTQLSQADLYRFATDAGRSGWTDDQLTARIVSTMQMPGPGYGATVGLSGQINSAVDAVKSAANQYLTPITDQTAFDLGKKMLTGEMDANGLGSYFKDQALIRFQASPQMLQMLDKGYTPQQIFSPYVQQTAQLLEVSPSQIDLMDQKYSKMVDYVDDSGNRRPMTLTEAGQYIRGTDAYKGTQGAVNQAADYAEFIAQKMGAVA